MEIYVPYETNFRRSLIPKKENHRLKHSKSIQNKERTLHPEANSPLEPLHKIFYSRSTYGHINFT